MERRSQRRPSDSLPEHEAKVLELKPRTHVREFAGGPAQQWASEDGSTYAWAVGFSHFTFSLGGNPIETDPRTGGNPSTG
jgi:hypothetical protein